jgi:hypothetical protein
MFMNGNEGISVADALALRNSGNDGFGGDGAWWIIILILLAAFGGWGNGNGFGGGGNNGWNACCTPATMAGMTDAFNFNQLDNGVRGLERGLCDGFYSMNNAVAAVGTAVQTCCCNLQQSMCQGFNGINTAIMQNGYQTQAGFNALGAQLASCCCDIERGQDAISCQIANNARDIMIANDKNTDRIINFLTQTEMDKLRTELQSAQFQLSQLSQTSNIVNQLMPVAKPAYLTCSPYAAAFGLYGNNGCGNGCGCC